MSAKTKQQRPKARLAKGFRDVGPDEVRGVKRMMRVIEEVFEAYGFEPLELPFIEYTDALGKFLPDQDRPNEGVFSFQDEDEQWLSLRYDLTAPLARYIAENQQSLPTPYRGYRQGWVFRNEKPGPGRFRQFMQFDADTVGSASPAADAEICMMIADTMEKLGIEKGQYVLKINNRKILDGVMEAIGLGGSENASRRLTVLRAMDKLDRLGPLGVRQLLAEGRKDESGDYTLGAGLATSANNAVISSITLFSPWFFERQSRLEKAHRFFSRGRRKPFSVAVYRKYLMEILSLSSLPEKVDQGLEELETIRKIVRTAGYTADCIRIDPSVVRGLEYYTGPVFECELLMEVRNEEGQLVRFGSVGGGGRYDDLVARFTGQQVPATGFSIGVSRLYTALKLLGRTQEGATLAPVVVLVMDRDRLADYQRMVSALRSAGIRAEMYVGSSGMKAQMKYADKRGSPLVVIQGGDEKAKGEVQIKDLALGAELAGSVESRADYKDARLAQFSVPETDLVTAVREALAKR